MLCHFNLANEREIFNETEKAIY